MDLALAERMAMTLMREHGLLDAGWKFRWGRGRRQFGCCQVRHTRDASGHKHISRIIRLSKHLARLNVESEVRDTILHEIAHALAGVEHGHDEAWRRECQRIGAKPVRLAGETVQVAPPRYVVSCDLCRRVLGHRHRRMATPRLVRSYCLHCGPKSIGCVRQNPA